MASIFLSKHKTDEKLDWSKKGVEALKEKIIKTQLRFQSENPPRILFLGETGAGKTSLISSFVSIFKGEIVKTSQCGFNHENTTQLLFEHRIDRSNEIPLNFILCDTRGIGKNNQLGITEEEINLLLNGKLHRRELLTSEKESKDKLPHKRGEKKVRQKYTPASGVVFVQKATHVGDCDEDVERKLRNTYSQVNEKAIPSCLVLTHIDKAKPSLVNKLNTALTNEKITMLTKKASDSTGFEQNRIFVVQSYVDDQHRLHTRQSVLLLRALHCILIDVAQYYSDNEYARRRQSSLAPCESTRSLTNTFPRTPHELTDEGKRYTSDAKSTSSTSSGDMSMLEEAIHQLSKHTYPAEYNRNARFKGAKPLFKPRIRQLDSDKKTEETGFQLQLQKESTWEEILEILKEWHNPAKGAVWISDFLPIDLSLPLRQSTPESIQTQLFCLSPTKPAFFLSLYSKDRIRERLEKKSRLESESTLKQEIESVQEFTTEMSRLMSSSLLNYCHCDFIILPCIMEYEKFTARNLQKQIDDQIQKAKRYFGGPLRLTSDTYEKLKAATSAVVSASHVSHFLVDNEDEEDDICIILLDPDWQKVVSLALEAILKNGSKFEKYYTYNEQSTVKLQIAVLEAAKRLSFTHELALVTQDKKIKNCAERLRSQVKRDTGLNMRLKVFTPDDYKSASEDIVILLNSNGNTDLPLRIL